MSQIFKAGITSSPSVPTSFSTDGQDTSTASVPAAIGSAVPQANILRAFGANGIKTYQTTLVPGVLEIGFNSGTNTTLGIATATILTITPTDNDTTTYQILISGYDPSSNLGVGGQIIGTIRKTAGVVTVLGTPDVIVNGDPVLNNSTFTIVASGGNVLVQATSASVDTVTWTAITAGQV